MKVPSFIVALLCSAAVYAHTPVCRCERNDNRIDCEGGYHDGSSAVDVTMRVITYTGESLAIGKLDNASRFSTALPTQPFYILMDVGPGEIFEVDWRDIEGMDKQHFQTNEQDESPVD